VKPCHAAALALVGWYLIAPSDHWAHDDAGGAIATRWYRLGVFDTAAQCDQALRKVKARVDAAFDKERRAGHKLTFQMGDGASCESDEKSPSLVNLPVADPSNPISP
jgi:hypothetical protein